MKRKIIFILSIIILLFPIISIANTQNIIEVNALYNQNNDIQVNIKSQNKIKQIRIYKKSNNEKYRLIYIKTGNNANEQTVKISSNKVYKTENTYFNVIVIDENGQRTSKEIQLGKLPSPSVKPKPTASNKPIESPKPTTTTKPTPSVNPTPSISTTPSTTTTPTVKPTPSNTPTPEPTNPEKTEKLEVHYIDPNSRVDAIYIKVGDKSIFIDGGFNRDAKAEIAYLKRLGVKKIDYYIGTHAHSNHVGAAGPIIKEFGIKTIYTSNAQYNGRNSVIAMMESKAKNTNEKNAIRQCQKKVLKAGDSININNLKIKCIGPVKLVKAKTGSTTENQNSLILRFEYGETSFLMAGDTGSSQLSAANKKYPGQLNVDVYKNSHHNSSLGQSVLSLISPKCVIFTTKDGYLPKSSYLKLITKNKAKYYIVTTKKDKNVLVTSDGKKLAVKTRYNVK